MYALIDVEYNTPYFGETKEELVNSVITFSLTGNKLTYILKGYKVVEATNYSSEWTYDEMRKDAYKFLFEKVLNNPQRQGRYKIFKSLT